MDISDIVSTEYVELSPDTPVSKLGARFEDPSIRGSLVTNAGEFGGVVTRRQLAASHHPPEEGVREVARLMLDDLSYNDVAEMIDGVERQHGGVDVLLLFARVRLDTDCGLFVATDEGYGAENAISEALDTLTKQLREKDTYAESKKHPSEEFWEKRFGWWLEV